MFSIFWLRKLGGEHNSCVNIPQNQGIIHGTGALAKPGDFILGNITETCSTKQKAAPKPYLVVASSYID